MTQIDPGDVGVVVIGRNEGERLVQSLTAAVEAGVPVVYVDSDSSDGSSERARQLVSHVVELSTPPGQTAARARNAGFERMQEVLPGCKYIQFVDGDCVLMPGWVEAAASHLRANPHVGIACGHLLEDNPEASPYHRLASMEWQQPVGVVGECGGIAMASAAAFDAVGGYEAGMAVGEDPDFCRRVGAAGMETVRLDQGMAKHDIDMFRFSQWWSRQVRPGKAWADTWHRRRAETPTEVLRNLKSTIFWGGVLPIMCVGLAPLTGGASVVFLLVALGILWLRIRGHSMGSGRTADDSALYASACTLAKFAAFQGVLGFARQRVMGG